MAKKKPKKRSEHFAVTLLSILFLTTAVFAAVKYMIHAPEPDDPSSSIPNEKDDPAQEEQSGTISSGQARKEYCYTILVSGLDDDNGGSDTNILVRFDAKNKTIDLVSLPRDTLLNHEWYSNKLNFAYAKGGTDLLRSEVSDLLGIPVDFYVTVNLQGFIALVDQIGGVDFDIPVDMDYDDPVQDLHIHFSKGPRRLTGQEAMEVVRWRKNNDGSGYATADIGRIGTQQAFLKAVASQLLQLSTIKEIPALVDIFFSHVKTDLELGELIWLGNEAKNIGLENVSFYTLPGDGTGYYRGESVYVLDPEETLSLVNTALNPYVEDITADDMNILVP